VALAHPESLSMTRSMGHDINTEKQVRLEPLKSRIEDATRVGRGVFNIDRRCRLLRHSANVSPLRCR
jgi:hypothetical protein